MIEFRAKLRKPKSELVLGAIVSALQPRVSARGLAYVVVRFSNYPLVASLNEMQTMRLRQAMRVHGLTEELVKVGDVVHLNVRWIEHDGHVFPEVRLDDRSILEEHLSGFVNRRRAA